VPGHGLTARPGLTSLLYVQPSRTAASYWCGGWLPLPLRPPGACPECVRLSAALKGLADRLGEWAGKGDVPENIRDDLQSFRVWCRGQVRVKGEA
jgi:hypothetical protein